jgi:uroporphyrinogen decarboxylase
VADMTSREIIRRVISGDHPPRIGLQFRKQGYPRDILILPSLRAVHPAYRETDWGSDPAVRARVPGFTGQARTDIWGRLDLLTKGECIRGVLQDGWEALDAYRVPSVDEGSVAEVRCAIDTAPGRYRLGMLPGMPFSVMRYVRRMETFLADILLEPRNVARLQEVVLDHLLRHVDLYAEAGADGVFAAEDWGTQDALLISPASWRALFRSGFEAVAARAHQKGMAFILHSCGCVYEIIADLVDAGVDVLQFDQPGLVGVEKLAKEFGKNVVFWSPVDIQRVMPTGDRALIEKEARLMIRAMGSGLIAGDYAQWEALGVQDEWAEWARLVFMKEGAIAGG